MGHFCFPVICTVLSSVAHCDYFPSFYNLQGISSLDLELFFFPFFQLCVQRVHLHAFFVV